MLFSRQSLNEGLTLAADIVAKEIRAMTTSSEYAHEIPEGIEVGEAVLSDTGGHIGVYTINRGQKGKEDNNVLITIAFELGSGLTGPRGEKYPIVPTEGKVLVFPWSVSWNIGPPGFEESVAQQMTSDDGMAHLPRVMHPGIKPKPFLFQAMSNVADRILDVLAQSFEYKILDGPKIEVIR